MVHKTLRLPDEATRGRKVYGVFDDFNHIVTGDTWTITKDAAFTISVPDAVGGLCRFLSTAVDNEEGYIETKEIFKIAQDKPMLYEVLTQFTEGDTDKINAVAGFMSAVAANSLQDDGAGPQADYSGAVFFKEDGQTLWSIEYSDSTTQETVQLTAANSLDGVAKTAGGAAAQRLRIELQPYGSDSVDVNYFIDDVLVYRLKDKSYANATECAAMFGVKVGSAAIETVDVDSISAWQER